MSTRLRAVPFRYRDQNFVKWLCNGPSGLGNSFYGSGDPWRIFLNTDHPNGARPSRYNPHLEFRLLMDQRASADDMLEGDDPSCGRRPGEPTLARPQCRGNTRPRKRIRISSPRGHGAGRILGLADSRPFWAQGPPPTSKPSIGAGPTRPPVRHGPNYCLHNGRVVVREGQADRDCSSRAPTHGRCGREY